MTVITLDIDKIPVNSKINLTKETILNNDPIENNLHVICVVSNPCLFKKRYELAKNFIRKMEKQDNIILYIVELMYGYEDYYVTDEKNPRHLRLHGKIPLWHKENMINLGIKKLLPNDWRAVAWIDADIEFDSPHWALDTLKILNGYKDIVQLFSHAIDMDKKEYTMRVFTSFGYNYESGKKYVLGGNDYWHPGFAWACTRKAYEKMGSLYEKSILGSGDHNMALSLIGNGLMSVNQNVHEEYKKSIEEYQKKVINLRLGYVPGIIRHFYHGSKADRKYKERWQILVNNNYNPDEHIKVDSYGLIIPTDKCPKELLSDILTYFRERNEDD
jgi:hypothetical protein